MKNSSNQMEMMESRTLLSSAVPFHAFAFVAHALDSQQAVSFVPHIDHNIHDAAWSSAGKQDAADLAEDARENLGFRVMDLNPSQEAYIGIMFGGFHEGWFGHFADYDGQMPTDPPAHIPGSDDSGARVTGRPARVPQPQDLADATPAEMSDAVVLRDAKPIEAVSTALLHESATITRAAAMTSSAFSNLATISIQGVLQSAKSNMIYLSFLDHNGSGDSVFASLAARLRSVIASLPAVAVRETGVAIFANGGNMIASIVSPRSFEFAHFNSPLMLVADSVGSFIQASALMPLAKNLPVSATRRAWMVTAAVLGADVVLLSYYYQKRRKAALALASETVMSR